MLATHSTILLLFPRTNSRSVARESDATDGSKARKIFALRNRPVSRQPTNLHTHAPVVNSSQWRASNRFSFAKLSYPFQIYRPPLSLSLENKYLSPRFNPWPQNQFAAAKDLAIFEPCALLPGRDAEDPWKVGL